MRNATFDESYAQRWYDSNKICFFDAENNSVANELLFLDETHIASTEFLYSYKNTYQGVSARSHCPINCISFDRVKRSYTVSLDLLKEKHYKICSIDYGPINRIKYRKLMLSGYR